MFVVRGKMRDALQRHLQEQGVGSVIHYPKPPHLQKAYATEFSAANNLGISEQISAEVLSLPIGPHLSEEQMKQVVRAVKSFY